MELTFQRNNLLYSLQVLQGVASGRSTLPILSNVLIQAEDGKIECVATDLEVGIKIRVEGGYPRRWGNHCLRQKISGYRQRITRK